MLTAAVGLCGIVMQFGIFLFGAYLAMEGRITGGAVIAIVNLSGNVLNPIQTVPQYWAARKAAGASLKSWPGCWRKTGPGPAGPSSRRCGRPSNCRT